MIGVGRLQWLVALSFFTGWFLAGVAPASAAEQQPKALIWAESAGDRALVKRVRGQVSDLDFAVSVVDGSAAGDEHVSSDPRVFALVWFARIDPTIDRIVVHATGARGEPRPMFVREIGDGASTPNGELTSATLEAAAVVIREALRELAAEASAAPAPVRNDSPPPRAVIAPEREPPEPTARPRIRLRGALTYEAVVDGVGALPRSGPGLRLGASYRVFELSAFATASLPAVEQDRFGSIGLRRDAFGLHGARPWVWGAITLEVGFVAGVALYVRNVHLLAPAVSRASDRVSVSPLLGPELRFGWAPGAGPVELGLLVGVNAVPGAPRIGYQIDGRFEPSFVIWRVQPTFGIAATLLADRER